MKKLVILIAGICLFKNATSQSCNCEDNLTWVKKTFEENDAGFQYIVDQKGKGAYEYLNQTVFAKAKNINNNADCEPILREWLSFFRKGHLDLEWHTTATTNSTNTTTPSYNTASWQGDLKTFEKYIQQKKEVDFEGIWEIGVYKVGIKKEANSYVGFIIETSAQEWKPKQIKLSFPLNASEGKAQFYLRNHSLQENEYPILIGKNHLQIGPQLLKRVAPNFADESTYGLHFKAMQANEPFFEKLDENTTYLRIPSFEPQYINAVDKVVLDNKELITKTENLIIDIRNNGGGSDRSFKAIIPLLYTNPIRTIYLEMLASPLNTNQFLSYSINEELPEETREWAKGIYEKMKDKPGQFVNVFGTKVDVDTLESVYLFPKNVGILINENNGSTAEQFLLSAKQSKKTKLYGTTTFGALDISNMTSTKSPCGDFSLWYAMSKSYRIPGMAIDNVGIQPDYFLDSEIPQHEWINYVRNILNNQ